MSSDNPSLPLLLTVQEAAELLRTTKSGIYAMVERGQLPGVTRIGRRVLIRSAELLRWLDQKSAPSPRVQVQHSAVPIQSSSRTPRK